MKLKIVNSLYDHRSCIGAMLSDEGMIDKIEQAAILCIEALKRGNKIMLCGNGGSAADAQHIAAELVGRFKAERKPLAAIALTTDTSALTAIANDYGYDQVFARQVGAIGKEGDVLIVLSTSGNSKNVINAMMSAKDRGATRIAITGKKSSLASVLAKCCIQVPSTDTARIQECHILIGHILCQLIEEAMFETA